MHRASVDNMDKSQAPAREPEDQRMNRIRPTHMHHETSTTTGSSRNIVMFYLLALVLATACTLYRPLLAGYMFTPAIAALCVLFLVERRGRARRDWKDLGVLTAGWRWWLPATLLPMAIVATGYAVAAATGHARLQVPWSQLYWGNMAVFFLGYTAANTLTMSLGEELGWRGWLHSRLLPRLGATGTHLAIGLAWAAWHLPLILLTDDYFRPEQGDRLLLTALFIATVTAIAVVIGELRLRSGSVWVASLMHSSHNVFWGLAQGLFAGPTLAYVAGESGVVPLAGYAIAGALLVASRKRHESAHAPTQERLSGAIRHTPTKRNRA